MAALGGEFALRVAPSLICLMRWPIRKHLSHCETVSKVTNEVLSL
jgi:hypothetical protein